MQKFIFGIMGALLLAGHLAEGRDAAAEQAKLESIARGLRVSMLAYTGDRTQPPVRLDNAPLTLYGNIEGGGRFFKPLVVLPNGGYMVTVTPSPDSQAGCYRLDVSVQTKHGAGMWQSMRQSAVTYCGDEGFKSFELELVDTHALLKSFDKKQDEPEYRVIRVTIDRAVP